MKKILLFFTLLILSGNAIAQIYDPVKWTYSVKRLSRVEAIVYFTATIQPQWHIYSQKVVKDGPLATSFKFLPSSTYQLSGKALEPKSISKYEKVFSSNVNYFEKAVTFQQNIKLISSTPVVKGTLEYMACTDSKCLPAVEVDFAIAVK